MMHRPTEHATILSFTQLFLIIAHIDMHANYFSRHSTLYFSPNHRAYRRRAPPRLRTRRVSVCLFSMDSKTAEVIEKRFNIQQGVIGEF